MARKSGHNKVQTMKTSPYAALFRFITAATIVGTLPQQTHGHGIEVRECRTPSGDIRFFVEHWHTASRVIEPTDAGTMNILFENLTDGTSPNTRTKYPDGILNNKNIYSSDHETGWGCINDDTPNLITSCHDTLPSSTARKSTVYCLAFQSILISRNV